MSNEIIRKIKLVVFDFDGVFTDNRVLVDEYGHEAVFCWRGDGIGLKMLQRAGIETIVLSSETNPVVERRCAKLGITCFSGCEDKKQAVVSLAEQYGVSLKEVAFVGNDVNDLEALKVVGLPICVQDAYPQVKDICRLITTRPGGYGAVREVCEYILKMRGDMHGRDGSG